MDYISLPDLIETIRELYACLELAYSYEGYKLSGWESTAAVREYTDDYSRIRACLEKLNA